MRAASSAGLRPLHLAAVVGLALVASVAATASAAPASRPASQHPNNAPVASFQILDAVVVSSPLTVGSACPAATAANHSAIPGATGQTIAICGRNLANAPRTPTGAHSSLGGTLIASHGAFTSGRIEANSGNVVLGNWANVTISSSSPGPGKTVLAKVGSNPAQASPLTLLGGYSTNEAPVAAAASATTDEDTASGPISLSASDANGNPMTFSIDSGPAHGTLGAISAAACPSTAPAAHSCTATVVYTPAANYNGPDGFTYIATDSLGAASAPATVSLTVSPVNDAPVVNPATFTIAENSAAGTAVGTVASSDVDTGQTRTYSIQAGNTGGAFAIDASTGAITVADSGPLDHETTPSFSLTLEATDDGTPAESGQATVTVNVTDVNEAPTLDPIADPAAILEDAGSQTVSLAGIAAGGGESQTLTVTAVSDTPALIPNPTVTYTSPNATGSLAYTPVGNQSGSAVITVTVTDDGGTANGGVDTFSRIFTVTVTPVNDSPTMTTTAAALAYTEGNGAVEVDSGLTLTDLEGDQISGATVQITNNFVATEDDLAFVDQLGITTQSYDDATGTLTLTGTTTIANYQTALRTVTYANSGTPPSTAMRTVSFQATDTGTPLTQASNTATRDITVATLNQAPVVTTSGGDTTYTENAVATTIDGALTVTDADDTNLAGATVQITTGCADPQDVLALASPPAGITAAPYVPAACLLTFSGTASVADYQAALRAVTYANSSDDPSTAARTVTFKVNDGDDDSNLATKGIAVTAVNDGPLLADKSHAVTGNVDISVPAGSGLLIGVTDPEGDTGFVASIDGTSTHLGDAVINGDGSYTFNPKAGRQGLDTVIFRVCDDGTPSACSTADLDLTVADMIWFVDNSEVSPADGRISSPFNTLGDLAAINDGVDTASSFHPAAGDTIFVYRDSATDYTGGLTLLASQKLVGAGATASLSTISGITLAADSVAVLPATGGIRPNVLGGVVLGSGNTVRGLTLGNATTSLSGTSFGTLTLASGVNADVAISSNGRAITLATGTIVGDLISVNSTGGTNNILLAAVSSSGTSLGSGALSGATGDSFAISGGTGSFSYSGSITASAANSVDIANKTGGTVTLSGAISDTGAGMRLVSNTGATIAFSGGITVSSGTNPAFTATGGGTVSVTGATNTLVTTTGTALNVANTTIGASGLTFSSVSANGAANGIVLTSTGSSGGLTITGTGTANSGGTIQNITGTGHGIALMNTRDVSLSWMNIQNTGGSGIFGTGVTNFSFVNGTINNSGTGLVAQTSNIAFNNQTGTENNISGTVTITGNTLTNAYYHGVSIFNFAGTISDLNVSNNTLTSSASTASSVGGGIQAVAFGSASGVASITKATLDNNTINNFPSGVGLQVQCGNANSAAAPSSTCGTPGSGTNVIAITNNKINATGLGSTVKTGAEGIIALVNGVGQGNFNIAGNTVQQNTGTSISSSAFGNANVTETITGNTVISNNTVASQGIGIGTSTTGGFATNSPQLTATITGNTVSLTDGNGILAVARDSSAGQLDVSIKNNVVAAPLTGVRPGIRVDAGNASGDNDVCLDISGNTSAGSGLSPGIGLRKPGTSTTINAFGIEGMAATATPGVEAFVDGQNATGGGTLLISATSGFSTCSSAP